MKLSNLLQESTVALDKSLEISDLAVNEKGKINSIAPSVSGDQSCPFWKLMEHKIGHGAGGKVRIPKVFAEKMSKHFKVPLNEQYYTPMCITGNKICPFFQLYANDLISCGFDNRGKQDDSRFDVSQGLKSPASKTAEPVTTPAAAATPAKA